MARIIALMTATLLTLAAMSIAAPTRAKQDSATSADTANILFPPVTEIGLAFALAEVLDDDE